MRARCARCWKRRASPKPSASRRPPMPTSRASKSRTCWTRRRIDHEHVRGEDMMAAVSSTWLSAHGKLWYDDTWYRLAWVVWPQALGIVLIMFLWAMPSSIGNVPWAKPMDGKQRAQQLQALRDTAKSNQAAMDTLERDARSGEMLAQFYYATLFDPDFKLSTIVKPDVGKAIDWYSLAARQGEPAALNNLAMTFSNGRFTRVDYTRACSYARQLPTN